ncbi:MAG: hypothetical protein D6725_12035 [Planctomycetota bacterium]|nr:MAG: hypothetical protein D6725_12035 [Planctomycetota bacterium]
MCKAEQTSDVPADGALRRPLIESKLPGDRAMRRTAVNTRRIMAVPALWAILATLGVPRMPVDAQPPADPPAEEREFLPVEQAIPLPPGFVERVFRDEQGEHKYVVFLPRGYDADAARRWPVVMYLHGASERGRDGRLPITVGLGPAIAAQPERYPFIAVFPQCEDVDGPARAGWLADRPDARRALKILDQVLREDAADPDRVVLTGWSMGGYGTWSIAAAHPRRFAAIVPVSGGGDPTIVRSLKNVPVWAFHGTRDFAVRADESRKLVQALIDAGGRPRLTLIEGGDHDVWKQVYIRDDLIDWMQRPTPFEQPIVETEPLPPPDWTTLFGQTATVGRPTVDIHAPFIPALRIHNALYLHLGREALEVIEYALPDVVSSQALSGRVDDFTDVTFAEGRQFNITFTGIGYSATLHRVRLQLDDGILTVHLGLRDVTLRIETTYVVGAQHSATAGPIEIVIGHQRPVWLSMAIRPRVQRRKIRLQLQSTRFSIPDDNWYVTAPAWVAVRGFGLTRQRVANGLVQGLYGSKPRIERQIIDAVPRFVETLQQQLDAVGRSEFVAAFWPLPVYRPRLRVWPQALRVDDGQFTLVMGITAAALRADRAPRQPREIEHLGLSIDRLPRPDHLVAGIAPGVIEPLTQMLVDENLARIDIRDVRQPELDVLADPDFWRSIIPAWKDRPPRLIRTELSLQRALRVQDAAVPPPKDATADVPAENESNAAPAASGEHEPDEGGGSTGATGTATPHAGEASFRFVAPSVVLTVFARNDAEAPWTVAAAVDMTLQQPVSIRLLKPSFERRIFRLDWAGPARLTARGRFLHDHTATPLSPQATERVQRQFQRGWQQWTGTGPASQLQIPDLKFGPYSALRIESADWRPPYLRLGFEIPPILLSNTSDQTLRYFTRGPYSDWGGPFELPPGETHRFRIPYPLIYRGETEYGIEEYTLPMGSHSEFRRPRSGGPPRLFQARDESPATQPSQPSEKPSGEGAPTANRPAPRSDHHEARHPLTSHAA